MTTCNEKHHPNHSHQHGPDCGHTAVRHEGHVDYLHDGHLHHVHGDHVDEHALAVDATNPVHCTPQTRCSHKHGHGCGHETVPHADHVDYLVNGRLHHPQEITATTTGRCSSPSRSKSCDHPARNRRLVPYEICCCGIDSTFDPSRHRGAAMAVK